MPTVREGVRAVTTGSMSGPSRSQSRSDLVRERYQALEEQQRGTGLQRSLGRPVCLPSVRSFSYEYPTQVAEMERMGNMHSSSPRESPVAVTTPESEAALPRLGHELP